MTTWIERFEWYYDSSRSFLGPTPGSLVPLNLFAAMFVHSHSDASMRILHAYTSLGIFVGLVSLLILLLKFHRNLLIGLFLVPLFVVNLWALHLNTKVAINGMDMMLGREFHVFLAILIVVNFVVFRRFKSAS